MKSFQPLRTESRQMPSDVYQESAQEAFSRCHCKRMQFGQYLRQQTRQQNFNFLTLTKTVRTIAFKIPTILLK